LEKEFREDSRMRAWSLIIGLILMGTLAGCAGNTSLVEQEWGTSYKLAVSNQILNPDADKNLEPVYGLGNKAADKVVNKYEKEFDRTPPAPTYTMGMPGALGTATSTGSQH
jgi:hypothetical protein